MLPYRLDVSQRDRDLFRSTRELGGATLQEDIVGVEGITRHSGVGRPIDVSQQVGAAQAFERFFREFRREERLQPMFGFRNIARGIAHSIEINWADLTDAEKDLMSETSLRMREIAYSPISWFGVDYGYAQCLRLLDGMVKRYDEKVLRSEPTHRDFNFINCLRRRIGLGPINVPGAKTVYNRFHREVFWDQDGDVLASVELEQSTVRSIFPVAIRSFAGRRFTQGTFYLNEVFGGLSHLSEYEIRDVDASTTGVTQLLVTLIVSVLKMALTPTRALLSGIDGMRNYFYTIFTMDGRLTRANRGIFQIATRRFKFNVDANGDVSALEWTRLEALITGELHRRDYHYRDHSDRALTDMSNLVSVSVKIFSIPRGEREPAVDIPLYRSTIETDDVADMPPLPVTRPMQILAPAAFRSEGVEADSDLNTVDAFLAMHEPAPPRAPRLTPEQVRPPAEALLAEPLMEELFGGEPFGFTATEELGVPATAEEPEAILGMPGEEEEEPFGFIGTEELGVPATAEEPEAILGMPGEEGEEFEAEGISPTQRYDPDEPESFFDPESFLGCCTNNELPCSLKNKVGTFYCPLAKDNNCLFGCLDWGCDAFPPAYRDVTGLEYDEINRSQNYVELRKACGISHDNPISLEEVAEKIAPKLVQYNIIIYQLITRSLTGVRQGRAIIYSEPKAKFAVVLFNERWGFPTKYAEALGEVDYEQKYRVARKGACTKRLFLYKAHCYGIQKMSAIDFVRCGVCYKFFKSGRGFSRHSQYCGKCLICRRSFNVKRAHLCKGKSSTAAPSHPSGAIPLRRFGVSAEYVAETNVLHADFETFQAYDDSCKHTVYSASTYDGKDLKNYIGPGALDEFMQSLRPPFVGTVVFQNGSGFDFLFIYNWLVENSVKIHSQIFKQNRILVVKFWNVCLFDIYLFTRSSLLKACADYGVPDSLWKKSFDHTRIQSWADVEALKDEVIEYNNYDVLSQSAIYNNYARAAWESYRLNINDYVTLSHMSFCYWTTLLGKENILIPGMEDHEYFHKALFGGRCYPQRRNFESKHYGALVSKYRNFEEPVTDEDFDLLDDYLAFVDVVSLYPSVMSSAEYFLGTWRKEEDALRCQLMEQRLASWDKPAPVIADVDIECPEDIITPFLMSRDDKGEIVNDLHPKRGVYCAQELGEAARLGYKITRVHSYVEFSSWARPFEAFVKILFEQKKASAKGSAAYAQSKLMMNGLSGKMSQKPIEDDWKVFTLGDEEALNKACMNKKVLGFEFLCSNNKVNAVAVRMKRKNPVPTKPIYLGAQILANSRVHMSHILDSIGGYDDPNCAFYYTDTDSYCLHAEGYNKLKKGIYWGKELGCICDDLEEGSKVLRAIFLAPKTYILEYLTGTSPHELRWKIRCKGIPHRTISGGETDRVVDVRKALEQQLQPLKDFKNVQYSLMDTKETPYKLVSTHNTLTYDMYAKMLLHDYTVVVRFLTFKSSYGMKSRSLQNFAQIEKIPMARDMCRNKWWSKKKRILSQSGISYPQGAKRPKRNLRLKHSMKI
jgi:hypothetical protein